MIYQVLVYIALILGFVPLILASLCKNLVFTKQYRGYIPLIGLMALASGYELVCSYFLKINSDYWFQIYTLFEFSVIFYFLKFIFNQRLSRYLAVYLSLFLLVYLYTFWFVFPVDVLKSKAIGKIGVSVLVFAGTFYWLGQLFSRRSVASPYNTPAFYFIVGLFMYYLNTIFFFVLVPHVYSLNLYLYDYWIVNVIATLFFRIMIILGVWKMI
ncbi:Uncharacterised protein [Myroides odoratus]|uniref:Uncharacterized protein n=2 Tax=Myroides odoratus TaxID=256 RepID=A0A9Q6Z780_MYROD|nr:hypothetical protein Myrod_3478 [Myroides odoratus DSM 2801]EKB03026.1 hypothetical protein HMPREF9716_03638 [Myroides odoratus CIP 103059]QQU01552.1 hypothetical protein I6I88_07400 [Myroides odoratus]STZ31615.1 Uncharacterised protein [Myroides odoratus]